METNNKKCPYCNSKLKKSELNCPKCREKIFSKETRIKSLPWTLNLKFLSIPLFILVPVWFFIYLIPGISDFGDIYILIIISVSCLAISPLMFIFYKTSDSYFIISSEKIQVKTRLLLRINNNIVIELLWKEINKLEIIKEIYSEKSSSEFGGNAFVYGYNLKFYLSKGESSVRLRDLNFYQRKIHRKIANLVKEFSEHLKKELIKFDDLEKIKN